MNLSDAFTFEEQEKQASDSEGLEMKTKPPRDLLLTSPPASGDPEATKHNGNGNGGKVVNPG